MAVMRGELVSLVPVGDDDYRLLATWAASAANTYSSGSSEFASEDTLRTALRDSGGTYLMVVTRDGRRIGAVNWRRMSYHGSYTVGNTVGDSELWGVGYGVESIALLLEHLFHARNAHRIHFLTGTHNKPMVQIFTQGLITIEGILRDYFFVDGEYHDAVVGSILRHEYYDPANAEFTPRDVIPAEDKATARALLRNHLARHPIGR